MSDAMRWASTRVMARGGPQGITDTGYQTPPLALDSPEPIDQIHLHTAALRVYAARMIRSSPIAKTRPGLVSVDDLVQETFIRTWAYREKIDLDRPLKPFLYTVLRNCFYDLIRRKYDVLVKSESDLDTDTPEISLESLLPAVTDRYDEADALDLEYLIPSEPQRQAMMAVYGYGMTADEYAASVGVSPGTIRRRLMLGKQRFKDRYRNDD